MNNTRGSTPPNPNLDLPNRSTDLNKTLGIIETPHEESIAKFNPIETCTKRRNRRNLAKNTSNPRTRKTPKSSPFTQEFGRGITAQRTTKVPTNFPRQIPKSKVPKTTQRNHQERAPKITTKNSREQHIQTLRNYVESSIHATKVHTRSSLPPDHLTLSTRSHHEALKLVL
jgi:restriction endonuclease Mrr